MKKLVVVDDEYLVIEGIRVMLKRIGKDYELAGSASDGQTALELIEEVQPDVVFMDIRMPGLSGLEVIEHFYKKYPDMIFVLVSAYKEFEYARKGMELGVHSYLDKPITLDKLQSTLDKIDEQFRERPDNTAIEHQRNIQDLRLSINVIVEMINDSNTETWEEEVRRIQSLLKKAKYGISEYKEESYKLIMAASAAFYEKWKQYERDFNFPLINNLEELKTLEEVDEYVFLILQRIFEKISVRKIGSSHRVITQILDYINQNYNKDFGLNDMAEMVHMNHAYLSILFKDEVGISFVRYLTQIRMAHAKELLLKGEKVQDVSEEVGYNNYRYFCNIFKKEEGVTPMQFKGGVRKSKENV